MDSSEFFKKLFPPIALPFEMEEVKSIEAVVELTNGNFCRISVERVDTSNNSQTPQ